MMTSKITLTVALAAGLLLLALSDVGANPLHEKSDAAHFSEVEVEEEEQEAEMTEEEMIKLLTDCAIRRLRGAKLSEQEALALKGLLAKEYMTNTEKPEEMAETTFNLVLQQCLQDELMMLSM